MSERTWTRRLRRADPLSFPRSMYSFALSFQVFGKYAQAIPRMFLVLLGTVICECHHTPRLPQLLTVLAEQMSSSP